MAKMLLYLLNYVNSNSSADACEYDCDTFYDEIVVRVEEVTNAIKKLDVNKASGSDGICSERLKCADKALVPVLSMCFTSFLLVDICHSQCCQLYLCDCDPPPAIVTPPRASETGERREAEREACMVEFVYLCWQLLKFLSQIEVRR